MRLLFFGWFTRSNEYPHCIYLGCLGTAWFDLRSFGCLTTYSAETLTERRFPYQYRCLYLFGSVVVPVPVPVHVHYPYFGGLSFITETLTERRVACYAMPLNYFGRKFDGFLLFGSVIFGGRHLAISPCKHCLSLFFHWRAPYRRRLRDALLIPDYVIWCQSFFVLRLHSDLKLI